MEMATSNKSVTKHVANIPTWQFNIPPHYKPPKEWEETLEELTGKMHYMMIIVYLNKQTKSERNLGKLPRCFTKPQPNM
jgi:hypothetical protein